MRQKRRLTYDEVLATESGAILTDHLVGTGLKVARMGADPPSCLMQPSRSGDATLEFTAGLTATTAWSTSGSAAMMLRITGER